MDHLRWGIMATGSIARQFAGGLKESKTGELVAVGSRAVESAKNFTKEFGGKPYGSYDDLLGDPKVDAVYIATPHHMHYEWTIRASGAGKGILCEKPFTLNALEAQRALNEVRKNKVFFMEAFMYRCHPQTRKVLDLVRQGEIGRVQMVNSEFGFHAGAGWSNFRTDATVGGGALMDVGVYPLSFSRMIAGEEPNRLNYSAQLVGNGYDASGSGSLGFPGGMTAHFGTAVHLSMQNDTRIYGEAGMILLDSAWKVSRGSKIRILRKDKEPEILDMGSTNDELYGYEADAVAEFFEARECPYMAWDDTLGNMKCLDALKSSAGIVFAAETPA